MGSSADVGAFLQITYFDILSVRMCFENGVY